MNHGKIRDIWKDVDIINFRDITIEDEEFGHLGARNEYVTTFRKKYEKNDEHEEMWEVTYKLKYNDKTIEAEVCPACGKFGNHCIMHRDDRYSQAIAFGYEFSCMANRSPELLTREQVINRLNNMIAQYEKPYDEFVINCRSFINPDNADLFYGVGIHNPICFIFDGNVTDELIAACRPNGKEKEYAEKFGKYVIVGFNTGFVKSNQIDLKTNNGDYIITENDDGSMTWHMNNQIPIIPLPISRFIRNQSEKCIRDTVFVLPLENQIKC